MQGLTCDYPSNTAPDPDQDASNKAILAKINHAVTLLEELKSSHQISSTATRDTIDRLPDTRQVLELSTSSLDANPNQVGVTEGESAFTDDGFGRLEIPEAAARSSACESILRWPALAGITGNSAATSFALEEAACNTSGQPRQQGVIDQDGIWPLCRRFLALIHVKNPILDVSEFVQHARNAAEYGPGWDEAGCLVLLACALACVATPYDPDQTYGWQTEAATEDSPTNQEGVDLNMAEAFFGAARRRLGLLTNSVIAVQCQYLAGLYEKFLVRPLAAWSLLQTACAQLQALLYAKGLAVATRQDFQTGKRTRHIEQRLYWSCVKAECELRAELQLPSSGLLRFKYPDLFPSLSLPSTSTLQPFPSEDSAISPQAQTAWSPAAWQGSPASSLQLSNTDRSLQPEEERSWLHYLAEISLRGIMNRVLADLYGGGEGAWLTEGRSLVRRHSVYLQELESWHAHLPTQLAFDDPFKTRPGDSIQLPSNEFSFFLLTRYVGVMEWIHRPFLYMLLHGDGETSYLFPLAQRAVDSAAALVRLVAAQHRHGGIWGLVRRSFGAALVLTAAACHAEGIHSSVVAASSAMITLPVDWRDLVKLSLTTIRRWESNGITDFARMYCIIQQIQEVVSTSAS
ncbi:hypothetical protein FDECE_369 [Fusarium decemcellulare]|nr:hypothetical protein FDECE_369 [Fusarium decemcellulare]